jgi:hypothetical protein
MVQIYFNFCKLFKGYNLLKVVKSSELAGNIMSHIDQPYACACIETTPE